MKAKKGKAKRKSHWSEVLLACGACHEAVQWARGFKTYEHAWDACEVPSWICWFANAARITRDDGRRGKMLDYFDMTEAIEAVLASDGVWSTLSFEDRRAIKATIVRRRVPRPALPTLAAARKCEAWRFM